LAKIVENAVGRVEGNNDMISLKDLPAFHFF